MTGQDWTPREGQLEARAKAAGLTLIHPPTDDWVVIFQPDAMWDACTGLDEAEAIIEANEPGDPGRKLTGVSEPVQGRTRDSVKRYGT